MFLPAQSLALARFTDAEGKANIARSSQPL
jgi:hypothetical protein